MHDLLEKNELMQYSDLNCIAFFLSNFIFNKMLFHAIYCDRVKKWSGAALLVVDLQAMRSLLA